MKDDTIKDEVTKEDILDELENNQDENVVELDEAKDSSKKEKKKKKKDKIDSKDAKIEELNDRLLRNMAEFENFRKRSEKEKTAMYTIGAKSIVESIIPVIDNFERGLEPLSDEEREEPFAQGMVKIHKQLLDTMKDLGVEPIEAVGQEFSPDFHEAVLSEESDEFDSGIIIEEFQKGYIYKDTVVRYSMVKVAN